METDSLLRDFSGKRWDSHPFERLIEGISASPAEAVAFAEAVIAKVPEGGTFLDLTLSFVTPEGFNHLISVALRTLAPGVGNDAAESVIAHASVQFPEALHPHLRFLFETVPNGGTYYENWPWRDSGSLAHPDLLAVINSAASDDRKVKAWQCLLETRYAPALADAVAMANALPTTNDAVTWRLKLASRGPSILHEVGYQSPTIPLYDPAPKHMVFAPGYFIAAKPCWNARSNHPTWNLTGEYKHCPFGGYAPGQCGLCGGRLHHLISLPGELASSRESLVLATCLTCLGWERHFIAYRHDESGLPHPLDNGHVSPQFPADALKETLVQVIATPSRWRWQDWGLSNGRENLCRIGGHPSWIQSAEYPDCPTCGKTMGFLMQFDSDLPTEDGGEWLWGSGGICYGFWCASCRVSGFLWQCT